MRRNKLINLKVNPTERQRIIDKAEVYAKGNVSEYLRWVGACEPSDEAIEFLRKKGLYGERQETEEEAELVSDNR